MAAGFKCPLRTIGVFGFSSLDSILASIRSGRCLAAEIDAMERPKPSPRALGRSTGRRKMEAIMMSFIDYRIELLVFVYMLSIRKFNIWLVRDAHQ